TIDVHEVEVRGEDLVGLGFVSTRVDEHLELVAVPELPWRLGEPAEQGQVETVFDFLARAHLRIQRIHQECDSDAEDQPQDPPEDPVPPRLRLNLTGAPSRTH